MKCKGDQTQTFCSAGPPFYQLISLVFGLKYAIILHWQLKTKFGFLSEFGITVGPRFTGLLGGWDKRPVNRGAGKSG